MKSRTLKILLWLIRRHPDVAFVDVMTRAEYERYFGEGFSLLERYEQGRAHL